MKLILNIILTVVAILLFTIVSPINLLMVIYKDGLKSITGYFLDQAVAIDRFGNYNFRRLLNKVFITKDGYKFGDFRETISSALGKNKLKGTLTPAGVILEKILDLLDKDHSIKSIRWFPDKKL